jgi:hypothetical protein
MDREIPKLRFYYVILRVVRVSYSLHSHYHSSKDANQTFDHHTKNNRSSRSGIAIIKDLIRLVKPNDLFS